MVAAKPFADAGVPVLPWPDGQAAPALPSGHGGIAVRAWNNTRWDYNRPARPRAFGVDGRPIWHGYGRMVAVVAPGEHLVEVRRDHVEGTRLVHVTAGSIVELEYAAPHGFALDGVLTAPPARIVGTTLRPWLLFLVYLFAAPLVLNATGATEALGSAGVAVAAGLIAAGFVAALLWQMGVRRRGERYRAEAADQPRPVQWPTGTGVLLGHTPKQPSAGNGLELAAVLEHTVRMNGSIVESSTSPHGWVPSPRLWIDGQERPVSWSHWWFPLSPGAHEVRFEVVGTPLGEGVPAERPAPVTTRVDITENTARRLTVTVESRTEIRPVQSNYDDVPLVDVRARLNQSYKDWEAPTAAVAFTATPTVSMD